MTQESLDVGPRKVFVVSPIGKAGSDASRRANYALKYLIREALQEPEWLVRRADEGTSPDSIGHHVIKQIAEADLIVADLTDHNPNVFYELAIAHGWRKPVVHLNTIGQSVPFDIVDLRTIFYDITDLASVEHSVVRLREYAEAAIGKGEEQITPLSNFARFSAVTTGEGKPGEAVALMFEELSSRMARLDFQMRKLSQSQEILPESEIPMHASRRIREFVNVCSLLANDNKEGENSAGLNRGKALYTAESIWNRASPSFRSMLKAELEGRGIPAPF